MEPVSSIGPNLISSAITRFGSLALQKLSRLRKIDRASRGAPTKDKALSTALNDLKIVLGSYQGKLTEPLLGFLEELQRTGLIVAVAEMASLSTNKPEIESAFIALHARYLEGSDESGRQLFQKLTAGIKASLDAQVGNDALLRYLELNSRHMHKKLDEISKSLSGKITLDCTAFAA